MAHVNPVIDADNHYQKFYDYAERMAEAERGMADEFIELAMKADANAFAEFAPLVRDHCRAARRKQTMTEVVMESLDTSDGPTITEAVQALLNIAYGNLPFEVQREQARNLFERGSAAFARVHAEVE